MVDKLRVARLARHGLAQGHHGATFVAAEGGLQRVEVAVVVEVVAVGAGVHAQ
ncbi:hypothetical protein D3C81_1988270 [compost metagenome]